jgi:hypothetical protein
LIVGRAYPEPSKRHIETVCTGAITEDGELLRLYPISWRYLDANQQYKLWTWATFEIRKSLDDMRKESYRVREETISILARVESPAEQFSLLQRAIFPDRETLDRCYREDWTSLGLVEIDIVDCDVRERVANRADAKPYTRQTHLYVDVKPLEEAPVEMRIRYRCKNNAECPGHFSRLIGWEYVEAFRNMRRKYGSSSEAVAKLKSALYARFSECGVSTYALLGTHSRFPTWMIGQLYAFDKNMPPTLF